MEIKYLNQGKIYLKGKKESVWINPKEEEFEGKGGEARIIIFTDNDRNFVKLSKENGKVIISGPGEYEIGGVEISGINSMYALTIDGIKVVVVSKFEGEMSEKKNEKLEESDVLLISASENWVEISKKSAANYIVPVEYEDDEKSLKTFLDAFDCEDLEAVESLKVDKDNLPEGVEVVLLKTN